MQCYTLTNNHGLWELVDCCRNFWCSDFLCDRWYTVCTPAVTSLVFWSRLFDKLLYKNIIHYYYRQY